MKKVLFATTALIATASVAAADVSFGGYGRFGAMYSDGVATAATAANAGADGLDGTADDVAAVAAGTTNGVTSMTSRFRMNINASAEADNGLTFGAMVRMQDSATAAAALSGANFSVSASGLKVTVGNINGAIESMNGLYAQSLGLTGLGYHNNVANVAGGFWGWDALSSTGNGREGVSVAYSAGDFGVMASYSNTAGVDNTALNASYTFSGWTVALGYQDSNVNANDKTILTVAGKVGIAGLNLSVADNSGNTKYGIGADFSVGAATTVSAFVNSENAGEAYGLGVKHDLGGGTSIRGGVVQTATGGTIADLGLHFNF